MKKFLMLGAALLAMQALPAFAEGNGAGSHDGKKQPHGDRMFQEQDTNKDGKISQDEYLAFSKARFTETDADKNGSVTKEEVKTHRDAMKAKWKEKREEMKRLNAEKGTAEGKADTTTAPKE